MNYQYNSRQVKDGSFKYQLLKNGNKLTYAKFLRLLSTKDESFLKIFREALNDANSKLSAYFWECVPISKKTINKQFEFVVTKSEELNNITQNYKPFSKYLAKTFLSFEHAISFPNKNKDGILVIPDLVINEKKSSHLDYKNISKFTLNTPEEQWKGFWQEVANNLSKELEKSDTPKWLSTHGLGIHYLHVRIDNQPKYYHWDEYKKSVENLGEEKEGQKNSHFSQNDLEEKKQQSISIKIPPKKNFSVIIILFISAIFLFTCFAFISLYKRKAKAKNFTGQSKSPEK